MQLSDRSIRRLLAVGRLTIDPRPTEQQIQPATVDLALGALMVPGGLPYVLRPNEFVLGSTIEEVHLPADLAAQVKGRSTWARRGLLVECAGFVDPDFRGTVTLEIKNLHHEEDITLRFEDRIAQIAFYQLDQRCERPYGSEGLGSHYQGQHGPTPAAE